MEKENGWFGHHLWCFHGHSTDHVISGTIRDPKKAFLVYCIRGEKKNYETNHAVSQVFPMKG